MALHLDSTSKLQLLGFAARLDQCDGSYQAGPLVFDTGVDPDLEEAIYIQPWREGTSATAMAAHVLAWYREWAGHIGHCVRC